METITVGDRFATREDMRAAFDAFTNAEVNMHIAHEDVDAWHAPSECHGDVTREFERQMEKIEQTFGIDIREVFDCFGIKVYNKVIGELHERRCPFCR